jgi:pimeloyl-ACP methyl ester carboxylesterase
MKILFYSLLLLCGHLSLIAQITHCSSSRYRQAVFSQVAKTSQIWYARADPYGVNTSPQDLYLDFYEPVGDTLTERPLIIYGFGGAFLIGNKNQPPIPRYCEEFAKRGYVVAAIDYRIGFNLASTESAIRAVYRAAQDLRAAVRFFCQRASVFRIDTSSIILTGSSAGCFAGLHSTYFEESQRPAATFGIPTENTDLGCFDCSGNNDFGRRIPKIAALINHWGALLDTLLIENQADENCPVISFHGTNDLAVPYEYGNPFSYPVFPNVHGSKNIHARLQTLGIPNRLFTLRGEGHEPWLIKPDLLDTIVKHTFPFLYDEVLRPKPQKIEGDTVVCKGEVAILQAIPRQRSDYCWSVSPNAIIELQQQHLLKIRCLDTGIVVVKLIEKNYLDAVSEQAEFRVRVVQRPVAGFAVQANHHLGITIANLAQNFTAMNWNMGNGQVVYGGLTAYTYGQPGTYSILQTVSNIGCSDTLRKNVVVDTCPVANFTYRMAGDTLFLSAEPSNAITFLWDVNGTLLTGQQASILVLNSGTFPVKLTTQNSLGCTAHSLHFVTKQPTDMIKLTKKHVQVFPNPFTLSFQIIIPDEREVSYALYNAQGSVIHSGKFTQETNVFLPDNFPTSLYVLKLLFDNAEVSTIKLIRAVE